MESHDYEHYRNLTLMFFFEKLLEKGGKIKDNKLFILIDYKYRVK